MLGGMQLFNSADGYLSAVRAEYPRPAGVEKIRKVGYLRLTRRVKYDRLALGASRGNEYVFGSSDAREG